MKNLLYILAIALCGCSSSSLVEECEVNINTGNNILSYISSYHLNDMEAEVIDRPSIRPYYNKMLKAISIRENFDKVKDYQRIHEELISLVPTEDLKHNIQLNKELKLNNQMYDQAIKLQTSFVINTLYKNLAKNSKTWVGKGWCAPFSYDKNEKKIEFYDIYKTPFDSISFTLIKPTNYQIKQLQHPKNSYYECKSNNHLHHVKFSFQNTNNRGFTFWFPEQIRYEIDWEHCIQGDTLSYRLNPKHK